MRKEIEMTTSSETVIGNARIVLAERVIEHGWIALAEGRIAEVGEGRSPRASADAGGDLIIPATSTAIYELRLKPAR